MLKKLSNFAEYRVYKELAPATDRYGAEVYRKIRIGDVVDIDSLALDELRSYSLMAHLDFVVADSEQTPHVAVEFEVPGTQQRTTRRRTRFAVEPTWHCFGSTCRLANVRLATVLSLMADDVIFGPRARALRHGGLRRRIARHAGSSHRGDERN